MPPSKLTIERVPVCELREFERAFRSATEGQILSPITFQRAEAQSSNPNANPSDTALLVARRGKIIVGHLSLVPSVFWTGTERVPIVWTSAFFVHPHFRASMVAMRLVREAIGLKQDLFVTGFNEPSKILCSAMGFQEAGRMNYLKLDLHFVDLPANATFRLARYVGLRGFSRGNRSLSLPLLRACLIRWCRRQIKPRTEGFAWGETQFFSSAEDCVVLDSPCFLREIPTINWVLGKPWISENGDPALPAYHFSEVRPLFRYKAVRFENAVGKRAGFSVFLLTERRGVRLLKTLDYNAPTAAQQFALLDAALYYASQFAIDQLILPYDLKNMLHSLTALGRGLTVKQRAYQWKPSRSNCGLQTFFREDPSVRYLYPDGDCGFG